MFKSSSKISRPGWQAESSKTDRCVRVAAGILSRRKTATWSQAASMEVSAREQRYGRKDVLWTKFLSRASLVASKTTRMSCQRRRCCSGREEILVAARRRRTHLQPHILQNRDRRKVDGQFGIAGDQQSDYLWPVSAPTGADSGVPLCFHLVLVKHVRRPSSSCSNLCSFFTAEPSTGL